MAARFLSRNTEWIDRKKKMIGIFRMAVDGKEKPPEIMGRESRYLYTANPNYDCDWT